MKCINLIPSRQQSVRRRTSRLRRWLVICGIYVVMLIGVYEFYHVRWAGAEHCSDADLAAAENHVLRLIQTIESLEKDISGDEEKLAANRAVANQPDLSLLLTVVGENLGPELVLKKCSLTFVGASGGPVKGQGEKRILSPEQASADRGEFELHIRGLGKNQQAVWQFALRLERTGLFNSVKLPGTKNEKFLKRQVVAFEAVCRFGRVEGAGI